MHDRRIKKQEMKGGTWAKNMLTKQMHFVRGPITGSHPDSWPMENGPEKMQFVPLYGWIIEATVTFFLLLLPSTIVFAEQVIYSPLQQLQIFCAPQRFTEVPAVGEGFRSPMANASLLSSLPHMAFVCTWATMELCCIQCLAGHAISFLKHNLFKVPDSALKYHWKT